MITIIVFIRNKVDFESFFLPSLKKQKVDYQLIIIDNNDKCFKSPAEAFNRSCDEAKGKYFLFTNDKLSFESSTWLEELEKTLDGLDNPGVAGVLGLTLNGSSWKNRLCSTEGIYNERPFNEIPSVKISKVVQTLDDNLLIIPRDVFNKYKFDDATFDGDFFYGADYCLKISKQGYHSYFIPSQCRINASPFDDKIWKPKQIYNYKRLLFIKYRNDYKRIFTYLGTISFPGIIFSPVFLYLYGHAIFLFFKIITIIWNRSIDHNESLLNLGCGFHFPDIKDKLSYSVGVELYEPALRKSKLLKVHNHYIKADIRNIQFKLKSFDVIIAIEVLEHLTKEEGVKLLSNMELWARKRIIITTPNGYLDQDELDQNPYQTHKSGWTAGDFKKMGYITRGLGGFKFLQGEVNRVKYRPFLFWAAISYISIIITYFFPRLDCRILAIKKLNK